jgi:kynurenine formamidase
MSRIKTLFLSHFINEATPIYGGASDQIKLEKLTAIKNGNTANSLYLKLPNHCGTHIDFPLHFSDKGKNINDYPPEFWIFKEVGFIESSIDNIQENLSGLNKNIEFLIIKTGFGKYRYENRYWSKQPIILSSLAAEIKRNFPKIRAFGFDMISLTSKLDRDEGKKAHEEFLLEKNILVVEDMNLEFLKTSPKELYIFPLLIEGADGSPCTIIANF